MGNGICSSESVNGSRDVWSCKFSDSGSADHLVVMVNGILGRSEAFHQYHFILYLYFEKEIDLIILVFDKIYSFRFVG